MLALSTLTLYKNLDPKQPIPFSGKSGTYIGYNLRSWLNLHREGEADGICVFLEDDRKSVDTPVISLTFDESDTPGWNVQNRHDVDDGMAWEEARNMFISLAMAYGEWTRTTLDIGW